LITIVDTSSGMNKEELNNYVQKYSLLKIQKVLEGENLIEEKVDLYFIFALSKESVLFQKNINKFLKN